MNRLTCIILLAAAALHAESLTLTVNLKGFKSDKGTADVALFDQVSAFPTKPEKAIAKQRAQISGGVAKVEFRDLKPGTYAVSAYQDSNGNGKMDTNFIGIPKEPTGVSNDAKGRMGPPSFKDAQLNLSVSTAISISMQ